MKPLHLGDFFIYIVEQMIFVNTFALNSMKNKKHTNIWIFKNWGTVDASETDEFSEKFQRGGESFSIQKFMLQILDLQTRLFEHEFEENNSKRPEDALAEKHILMTDWQLEIKRC